MQGLLTSAIQPVRDCLQHSGFSSSGHDSMSKPFPGTGLDFLSGATYN